MNTIQLNYAKAKALYETLHDEFIARMTPYTESLGNTDEEIDKYVEIEMATEDELGLNEARQNMHLAEDALLEWGHNMVKRLPQYRTQKDEIEKVFSTNLYHIRQKVIDLSFKLEA